jgi:2,4-dienoyl-CoA reductase-like NADH-dependent reductase (Old Yellow Enzyme family)
MRQKKHSFICIKIISLILSLIILNLKIKFENAKLFDKYILNNKVQVPGLLTIAPLTLLGSNSDGSISSEERNYLNQRAKNIGLYILGATAVSQEGISFPNMPRALNDNDIPSLSERAKIIKDQGALAINQLFHGGSLADSKYSGTHVIAVSSDMYNKGLTKKDIKNGIEKKQLNNDDILRIINDFAKATELSIKAGYDGIEIHGANNYLLQQFYSGYYNKRTDEWGGSLEKRMRFPLEVVDACCKIRDKYNKPEFIIGYRLSPEEPFEDGITMTETLALVRALVKKPIQYIHISQKNYFQKARRGEGTGVERLKLIHQETRGKVALIGVGGLYSYKDFNRALKSEFSDFIGTGRSSMLNKNLGTLLKEERKDEINLVLDPVHPEKYSIPNLLWSLCIKGGDWLPPIKRK